MKEFFSKQIIERPRSGSSEGFHRIRARINYRDQDGLEELSTRQSMRRPYKERFIEKSFRDNLNPLERFIAKNIGRPWNKVKSEVVLTNDDRNVSQRHLLEHFFKDYVEEEVVFFDKEGAYILRWGNKYYPDYYVNYYGILCKNKTRSRYKIPELPWYVRKVNDTTYLVCRDATWFEIILRKEDYLRTKYNWLVPTYGFRKFGEWTCPSKYVIDSIRTLNKKEKKQYGLV